MLRSPPRRPGCLLSRALQGVPVGLAVAVGLHFAVILGGTNFRTVLPGRVYRSGQLSPARLESVVRAHGIRTVVCLRGCCPPLPWYRRQADATARLDICEEDVSFSAVRLPSAESVRQLVEVIERCEKPLLLHCQQGADRTGLASVMCVLLLTDAPLSEARRQLGPAYGHVALGRTAHIDRFFVLYDDWLRQAGREHSSAVFRAWATEHYCPDGGRARYELLGEEGAVRVLPSRPLRLTIRCHNESIMTWRFEPGTTAGTHGNWVLLDRDQRRAACGKTGLRRARVAPGESIDLDVALPGLLPGRYELFFDLIEEQHASFMQLGNQMLAVPIVVE